LIDLLPISVLVLKRQQNFLQDKDFEKWRRWRTFAETLQVF
jgi:hypothetical protein